MSLEGPIRNHKKESADFDLTEADARRIRQEILHTADNFAGMHSDDQNKWSVANLIDAVSKRLSHADPKGSFDNASVRAVFERLTREERVMHKIHWFIDESAGERRFDPSELDRLADEVHRKQVE